MRGNGALGALELDSTSNNNKKKTQQKPSKDTAIHVMKACTPSSPVIPHRQSCTNTCTFLSN